MNINQKICEKCLFWSPLALLTSLLLYILGFESVSGFFIILFFSLFLFGIQGNKLLKGFSFTVWVLAAVVIGLLYPNAIVNPIGFNSEALIVPLIQLIMFGMGTTMGLRDFAGILKMPKGVIIGLLCQFTIMPILAISLAILLDFPTEIAAGIVLVGASPSGVSSNIITFLAKGNLALSITLTSFTTLFAPIITPYLMHLLAGQFIPMDYYSMMWSIIYMLFLPIIAGIVCNRIFRSKAGWFHNSMPIMAMGANVLIIAIIIAAGRDSLLNIGLILLFVAIVHNAFGYLLGYWSCRLLKMNKRDSRTIAIEVGMQNGGMAAGIAADMGKAATMGLFPAIFGSWMDVSGSFLANWWRITADKIAAQDPEITGNTPLKKEITDQI